MLQLIKKGFTDKQLYNLVTTSYRCKTTKDKEKLENLRKWLSKSKDKNGAKLPKTKVKMDAKAS